MARYRDKKTGRLVSKSTWNRSKAHGGTRYVRESQRPKATEPMAVAGDKKTLAEMLRDAKKINTPEAYAAWWRAWEQAGEDFEDQGEVETGIDYGEE